jgi:hypothetical protein
MLPHFPKLDRRYRVYSLISRSAATKVSVVQKRSRTTAPMGISLVLAWLPSVRVDGKYWCCRQCNIYLVNDIIKSMMAGHPFLP